MTVPPVITPMSHQQKPTPEASTTPEAAFREAISHFATGVTIVTTVHGGRRAGMTASAVCAVSLEPLLLLVCIDNRRPTHEAIDESRRFAVNVLGEGDEALACRFALPTSDKFLGVDLVEGADPPLLRAAIAHLVCEVQELLPGGDHSIVVGRVVRCAVRSGCRPLVYFRSGFGKLHDAQVDIRDIGVGWDAW